MLAGPEKREEHRRLTHIAIVKETKMITTIMECNVNYKPRYEHQSQIRIVVSHSVKASFLKAGTTEANNLLACSPALANAISLIL